MGGIYHYEINVGFFLKYVSVFIENLIWNRLVHAKQHCQAQKYNFTVKRI